jgi:hypothetical protein
MKGLEPPRLAAPDPKSGAAANYATSANCSTNILKIKSFSKSGRILGSLNSIEKVSRKGGIRITTTAEVAMVSQMGDNLDESDSRPTDCGLHRKSGKD